MNSKQQKRNLAPRRLLATLALLALVSAALAQGAGGAGSSLLLATGSLCRPVQQEQRLTLDGASADYLCGEDGNLALVGGILGSQGQLAVEQVRFDDSTIPPTIYGRELAVLDVQNLKLTDGTDCVPANGGRRVGDQRISYDCGVTGDGQGSLVLLGDLVQGQDAGYPTTFATLALLSADGTQVVSQQRVVVDMIDAALPLTRKEWVLASWGTGGAPPLAQAAPTLSFHDGRIAGTTGCNNYFAAATSRGAGDLQLGMAGATLMACPPPLMTQERRYLRALDAVTGYELIDGALYLHGGGEVLKFESAR